ncbi:hypothetical protein T08_2253, partial [Trichinella sp. T8]
LEASEKDNKKFINDIPSNGSTSEKKPIQTESSGHSKFIYNPRNPKHRYYHVIKGWLKEQKTDVPGIFSTGRYGYKQVYLDIPEKMLEDFQERNINFKHTIEMLANVQIHFLKRKVSIIGEDENSIDAAIL